MPRAITRKSPAKSNGFSWGRFPMGETGVVAYRLFRRDRHGVTQMHVVDAKPGMSRSEVALELQIGRAELRDRVKAFAA